MKLKIAIKVILLSPINITDAATGNAGYAIYRDGVVGTPQWHAGLMNSPNSSYWLPVTHIIGGELVSYTTMNMFIDGDNFKGVYRPNQAISSQMRDMVIVAASRLRDEYIPYYVAAQINYPSSLYGTGYLYPEDITGIRCDGIVEYCYEFWGFRIFGSDLNWDISTATAGNWNEHSLWGVTPKTQAQNYMTLVQTTIP